MKNLLSIESLSKAQIEGILADAAKMKATRGRHAAHPGHRHSQGPLQPEPYLLQLVFHLGALGMALRQALALVRHHDDEAGGGHGAAIGRESDAVKAALGAGADRHPQNPHRLAQRSKYKIAFLNNLGSLLE